MLATGVIAPAVGYLGNLLSYKRLYLIAMGGFILFSAFCTFAWNIDSLIAFRVIQGLFSGIMLPTTMTIIYQVFEKKDQPLAMSFWSLSSMLAPAAVSPFIGKIYRKTGPFWLILIGTFLIGAATWALAHLGLSTSIGFIVALLVLRYIGIALSNMPVNNVGMSSIPKVDSGNASAITNWVRQGVAALSVGIFSSLLGARITVHLRELQLLYPAGHSFIGEQALTLGVNDVFMVGTTIAVIAIPVTILLRYSKVEARKNGSL